MNSIVFRAAVACVASGALVSVALLAGTGPAQATVTGFSVVPEAWGYTVTATTDGAGDPTACEVRVGPLSAPVPLNTATTFPAFALIPINVELYCDGTYSKNRVVTPRFS